jgi:CRISPR-associated protein (TIGR02584 family)
MKKMKTLVSLLGNSPGTVTGTYYALYEDPDRELPDRLVIVTTRTRETERCLDMISERFRHPADHEPDSPQLEIVRVPTDDLTDQESTALFQGEIARVLREQRQISDNEIWLSIAGGRKSMSALAAIAAQIIGVDKMIHLYVDHETEQQCDINQLLQYPERKDRCLHPDKSRYTLVDVPVFIQGKGAQQLLEWYDRGFEQFFVEVARANPAFLHEAGQNLDILLKYWQAASKLDAYRPHEYETVTLHIIQDTPDQLTVCTSGGGLPEVEENLTPVFTPEEIEDFVHDAGKPTVSPKILRNARLLGEKLFNTLFDGNMLRYYYRLQGKFIDQNSTKGVRLRLQIDPKAKVGDLPLSRVPWELMYDQGLDPDLAWGAEKYLGLQKQVAISRYVRLPQGSGLKTVQPPIEILLVAAFPQDLVPLPENKEIEAFQESLRGLGLCVYAHDAAGGYPGTWDQFRDAVEKHRPHVVYFTGHGGEGALYFEDAQGTSDRRSAAEIGDFLERQGVQLVVLNACYGAQGPVDDVSVAEGLLTAGVPAVVAMQAEILTGQIWTAPALVFVREFFTHLLWGWPIDACVTAARLRIYRNWDLGGQSQATSLQWATPVCFLRDEDGFLVDWEPG